MKNNNKIIGIIIDEPSFYRVIFDNNIMFDDFFKSFVIFKSKAEGIDVGFSISGSQYSPYPVNSSTFSKNPIGLNQFINMIIDKEFYITEESKVVMDKLLSKINSMIDET